jgi:hypothetical protein
MTDGRGHEMDDGPLEVEDEDDTLRADPSESDESEVKTEMVDMGEAIRMDFGMVERSTGDAGFRCQASWSRVRSSWLRGRQRRRLELSERQGLMQEAGSSVMRLRRRT